MDAKKLIIVAAAGLAVYMLASSQARAASSRAAPMRDGAAAPTGPTAAAAAREANAWGNVGQQINGLLGNLGRLVRGQSNTDTGDELGRLATRFPVTDTGDETARLAARYAAPDDAVPLSVPGMADQEAAQGEVWGQLLTGGGIGGASGWGQYALGF